MLAFSPVMVLLVTFPLTRILPTMGSLAPSVQYRTWSFKQSKRSRSPHSRQAQRGREGDGSINGRIIFGFSRLYNSNQPNPVFIGRGYKIQIRSGNQRTWVF